MVRADSVGDLLTVDTETSMKQKIKHIEMTEMIYSAFSFAKKYHKYHLRRL